ncbi:hypothetical protein IOC57_02415 [Bacillus sp. SD075]|uniref:hypothetical protein n=1 Tax=Bacillus sp. SD075 TaxID=2781732 RepID=UPI001A95B237|nr:hypothetical protein [Bacillus sp. SD075]MBO0996621.1 hypothetical protein [Bacillus sp. SD075]
MIGKSRLSFELAGHSRNSIIGFKAGLLKSGFTPFCTYAALKNELRKGNPWSGVFTNRKKSGDIWHSSITITPIHLGYLGYFVEIFTVQKRKGQRLKGNC